MSSPLRKRVGTRKLSFDALEPRCLLSAGSYTLKDLNTLPGFPQSVATAINANGEVVGYAYGNNGPLRSRAFLYSKGRMISLNPLPGFNNSEAYGINAAGQVVGYCYNVDGERTAFLYSNSTMTDLGTLPGYEFSQALGINASGQIVGGFSCINQYGWEIGGAFLHSSGTMTDLDTVPPRPANNAFGDFSVAYDINDSGQVVGEGYGPDGHQSAVLYTAGKLTIVCDMGSAYAINNSGQVVGDGYPFSSFGTSHAFLYSGGNLTDLGTLVGNRDISAATGINDKGQVVGWYGPNGPGTLGNHAFLYSDGQIIELKPPSGGLEAEAYGINAAGQVVGEVCNSQGVSHAALWQISGAPPVVNPVDLVVTDFDTQIHNRLGSDADRLKTSVTVANQSDYKSKAFDITYYAKAVPGPYAPGDLILGHFVGPALKPGQSKTLKVKIKDPIYMENPFTNGYYVGVQIDPGNKIAETSKANNFQQMSGADETDLRLDWAVTNSAWAFFKTISLTTASEALSHYLDTTSADSGKAKYWGPGTTYSNEVYESPEFTKSIAAARKFLVQELKKNLKAGGPGFSTLAIPQSVVGTPLLTSNLDLFFTMRGTQGSEGRFTDIQLKPIKKSGNRTVYEISANLSITYKDVYEFDANDARKGYWNKIPDCAVNVGSCMRHLQMCGWAKPFTDSVEATTTVGGEFTV